MKYPKEFEMITVDNGPFQETGINAQFTPFTLGLHSIHIFIFMLWSIQRVGSYFHNQGWKLSPLQWEYGVLITGSPRKSLGSTLKTPLQRIEYGKGTKFGLGI